MKNNNNIVESIIFKKDETHIKDFSDELLKNDLIIFDYFQKSPRDIKDYKYIPSHLLSNPMFVYSCLKNNPDIYLLADSKLHNSSIFFKLKELHPRTYLKYAGEVELKNKDICIGSLNQGLENFEFFPDYLKNDEYICLLVASKFYSKNAHYEDHTNFAKQLPKSLLENPNFVEKILSKQPTFITGIAPKYLNTQNIIYCVSKNSFLFSQLYPLIIDNDEVIQQLLNINKEYHSNITFLKTHIIEKLPIKYFTHEFCEKYKKEIKDIFTKLPKSHRGEINILKAIYTEEKYSMEMFGKTYINKYIPNEKFKTALIDFIFKQPHKEMAHNNMASFIEYYMLDSLLDKKPANKLINKI